MNTHEFANRFYNYMKQLFEMNGRDTDGLYFKRNKTTCNIMLECNILIQFKKPYEFYLKSSTHNMLEKYGIEYDRIHKKHNTIPFKINIDDFSFINDNADFLLELFDDTQMHGLWKSSDSFSFCSKWLQCANELRCVETDKKQAALCRSRKNIMHGLVFNGRNSVLDNEGKIVPEKLQRNLDKISTSRIVKIDLHTNTEQFSLI